MELSDVECVFDFLLLFRWQIRRLAFLMFFAGLDESPATFIVCPGSGDEVFGELIL